jgi:hypothetical protein
MQIGRRLYYEKATGKILVDKGDMQGDVRETTFDEDTLVYNALAGYTEETVGVFQLEFGERVNEFINVGSMLVLNNELIIYPRINITTDKSNIIADGIDSTTITVTIQDTFNPHVINFNVNDGEPVTVNTENGIAVLQFDTTLPGDYIIKAESNLYGSNLIVIKGV